MAPMTPASLRAVQRTAPAQPDLPLPAPPDRPFVSLARETRIGGGPVRKLVYLVLASYCPLMTKAWAARGNPHRETLQRVCEIGRIRTLDTHLAALRADGWISWTRRGRGHASEFEVRLAPIQEAIQGGQELHPECNSNDLRVALSGSKSCTLRAEELHSECKHKAAEDHGSDLQQQQQGSALVRGEGTTVPVQHATSDALPPAPTERQIAMIRACADRLGAEQPADSLLVDRRAVERLIPMAKKVREREGDFKHKHKTEAEIVIAVGRDAGILWRTVVQRCECGALRTATVCRDGDVDAFPWVLAAELAEVTGDGDYLRRVDACHGDRPLKGWREPLTWGEVDAKVPRPAPAPAPVVQVDSWRCAACDLETVGEQPEACECGCTAFSRGAD